MLKHDLILVCSILRVRENFKLMRLVKKIITIRKNIMFSIVDALLIYLYAILGLQADCCMNFESFWRRFHFIDSKLGIAFSNPGRRLRGASSNCWP